MCAGSKPNPPPMQALISPLCFLPSAFQIFRGILNGCLSNLHQTDDLTVQLEAQKLHVLSDSISVPMLPRKRSLAQHNAT